MPIKKNGASNEKLSGEQLHLLELEPGVSSNEVQAERELEALSPQSSNRQAQADRKHPGRQSTPAHLLRVEKIVTCTPEQYGWDGCGAETTVIWYEESEHLDVELTKYFVSVTRRGKCACKPCEERGVLAALLPQRIIGKSLVSDQIVIDTIVAKYCVAALSIESDAQALHGRQYQPLHHGYVGDDARRLAVAAHHWSDATRVTS